MRLSHSALTVLADGGDPKAIKAKKQWLAVSILRSILGKNSNAMGSIGIYAEYDEVADTITIREETRRQ